MHGRRAEPARRGDAPWSQWGKNVDQPVLVAADPAAEGDALAELAASPYIVVRWEVAMNGSTPAHILALLARDRDVSTRQRVAGNVKTPSSVLEMLAGDRSEDVRLFVASNPSTPGDAIESLAHRGQFELRAAAQNPSLPSEALNRLASLHTTPDTACLVASCVAARICETLGIDRDNAEAIDSLREQAWWDMTPEDNAVTVALALSPNA